MDAVLRAVEESAAREGITRVKTVGLVIGRRSGVLPDAVRFAFDVLARRGAAGGPADVGPPDSAPPRDDHAPRDAVAGEAAPRGDDLFRGAVLRIEERPVRARCKRCGHEYGEETGAPNDPDPALSWALLCPRCGAPAPEMISGDELLVDYYEGE